VLKAVARQRLHAGQMTSLLLRRCRSCRPGPGKLWAIGLATPLGVAAACGQEEVFNALVFARLIEPTSKLETIRVMVRSVSRRRASRRSTGGCPAT
jgi:hypothetical protein